MSSSLVRADTGGFQLSSEAFKDNAAIPKEYTCDGRNVNPPLTFHNVPPGTQSLALAVADPDAPNGLWVHWVIYNIRPGIGSIAVNTSPGLQGLNDFGKQAYGGPCPPPGNLHHYVFRAYALDTFLNVHGQQTLRSIDKACGGHILGKTMLVGTYQR
ncbi:MAG: YbhB/YbcL family Raf kinase inhibitor-like protein [Candidatus Omnitrophica bacterium]|nr:YbhB/YbcL family Raf kinase inhibitor-like protein [Candidatus Omnitrophota bacterium]MDE2009654.1 YbhB/YbcL family Raf kinase inhibitor-like protein [Candidatus Omnitrophota bacterium]MDE2214418.1 YbhB/YbcL family Raf kinase inhibitor-like protein [Candidatus Omnitrophota bacterium]MDE2231558.1 YbhB/YbcL family Raf kinase inhibitor-like protein [Candidatus Omnitrophota bacterium]